jgi:hypothetical protein
MCFGIPMSMAQMATPLLHSASLHATLASSLAGFYNWAFRESMFNVTELQAQSVLHPPP